MIIPDSKLVTDIVPSQGYLNDAYLPRVTASINSVVVHTTGAGPVKRLSASKFARWREKHAFLPRDLDRFGWSKDEAAFYAALWIYSKAYTPGPHYVVGQELGLITQVCPERLAAWHVGGSGSRMYSTRPESWWRSGAYTWWRNSFPDLDSPRDLAGGQLYMPYEVPAGASIPRQRARMVAKYAKGSVNAGSVGIEVVPRVEDSQGPWTGACWHNLSELLLDITGRRDIVRNREHVVTHSIAHPISRTTKRGKPWDTVSSQFTYEALERVEPRFRAQE